MRCSICGLLMSDMDRIGVLLYGGSPFHARLVHMACHANSPHDNAIRIVPGICPPDPSKRTKTNV